MSRFLHRVGLPRIALCAALGLLLVAAVAVGAAPSHTGLPFALSAAQLPTPTTTPNSTDAPTPTPSGASATGCGAPAAGAPGTTVSQTLRVGQLDRAYQLHIPKTYLPDVHAPLVLAFHGHGGNPAIFEQFTRLSQLADERGFLVVYPRGVVGPDGQTGWNTSRQRDPHVDDLAFVRDLLTRLQDTVCVDSARIYATGFSNGGGFVGVLACDLPDRIAAFAPVAGDYYPQPGGCHPARAVSLLEIHGTADAVNPYNGSAQLHYAPVGAWLRDWATRDGCAAEPALRSADTRTAVQTWGGCQAGVMIVHERLIGAGHVWPVATTGASDFDTDTAIWGFLSTQTLPAPPSG